MISVLCLDISSILILLSLVVITLVKNNWSNLIYVIHSIQLMVCLMASVFHFVYELILVLGVVNPTARMVAIFCEYMFMVAQSFIYPIATIYVCASIGIWYEIIKRKKILIAFLIIAFLPLILIVSNIYNQKYFSFEENFSIQISSPFFLIYSTMAANIVLALLLVIIYRKYLNKNSYIIAMILLPLNIAVIVIQSLFPDMPFLLFIYANSCYLVSLVIHRSEVLISPYSKAHSSYMFYSDAYKIVSMETPCNYVFIKILNYKNIQSYIGKQNCTVFLNSFSRKIFKDINQAKISGEIYYLENAVFAVSTQIGTVENLAKVFRKIKQELNSVILIEDFSVYIDTAICIASYPDDIYNYEYLKYFSKNFNELIPVSNDVVVVSDFSTNKNYLIKNEIDSIVERALKNHYFEIVYQPIFSVEKNRCTCVEALLRLKDPEFGYIPPAVFIPYAENTKAIYRITDYVINTVTDFIASEEFKYLHLEKVEINLSKSQCVDPNLVSKVQKHILDKEIRPENIRFEITESALDTDSALIDKNIADLNKNNIEIVLDNYGTGYTNIKKLVTLPLNSVKLDRSFIEEYDDSQIQIIVDETINMLKAVKKQVLVEGIEHPEHAEIFKKLGCPYLQGYYYSKPLTIEQLLDFLIQ